MRPVLSNLKPLLFKWVIISSLVSTLLAGFIFEAIQQNTAKQFAKTEVKSSNNSVSGKKILSDNTTSSEAKPAKKVKTSKKKKRDSSQDRRIARVNHSGNTYAAGNCTWYAKSKRPDLPNNLGNAYSWVSNARAQGISTGSNPKVGAVGQQGNHVVYAEKVNENRTVLISEMNFAGLGVVSRRTVPAGTFQYIY